MSNNSFLLVLFVLASSIQVVHSQTCHSNCETANCCQCADDGTCTMCKSQYTTPSSAAPDATYAEKIAGRYFLRNDNCYLQTDTGCTDGGFYASTSYVSAQYPGGTCAPCTDQNFVAEHSHQPSYELCAVSTPNECVVLPIVGSTATQFNGGNNPSYFYKHKTPCTQANPGYFLTGNVVLYGNAGTCSALYPTFAYTGKGTCEAYGKNNIQTVTCANGYEQIGTNSGDPKTSSYLDVSCKLSCTDPNCRSCSTAAYNSNTDPNVCTRCAVGYALQSDNTCVQLAAVPNSVGNVYDNYQFKPHQALQERTTEASLEDCRERCISVDGCYSFAFVARQCHLNSNADAVKTATPGVQSGLGGTPYTGNAGK